MDNITPLSREKVYSLVEYVVNMVSERVHEGYEPTSKLIFSKEVNRNEVRDAARKELSDVLDDQIDFYESMSHPTLPKKFTQAKKEVLNSIYGLIDTQLEVNKNLRSRIKDHPIRYGITGVLPPAAFGIVSYEMIMSAIKFIGTAPDSKTILSSIALAFFAAMITSIPLALVETFTTRAIKEPKYVHIEKIIEDSYQAFKKN